MSVIDINELDAKMQDLLKNDQAKYQDLKGEIKFNLYTKIDRENGDYTLSPAKEFHLVDFDAARSSHEGDVANFAHNGEYKGCYLWLWHKAEGSVITEITVEGKSYFAEITKDSIWWDAYNAIN